jgi:hypothetical protein
MSISCCRAALVASAAGTPERAEQGPSWRPQGPLAQLGLWMLDQMLEAVLQTRSSARNTNGMAFRASRATTANASPGFADHRRGCPRSGSFSEITALVDILQPRCRMILVQTSKGCVCIWRWRGAIVARKAVVALYVLCLHSPAQVSLVIGSAKPEQ